MSAEGLTPRLTEMLDTLKAAWRWWRDGILASLPESVRNAMTSGVSIVAIDLEDNAVILRRFADGRAFEITQIPRARFDAPALRAALSPYLSKRWLLRDSFALRLPNSAALSRKLSLPIAARGNIAGLLDIELERQSPIDSSEVYHDHRILRIDRKAGRIDIVWRIVRRRIVDVPLDVCRQAGADLAVIAFIGDETPPDGGNFPVEPRASLLLRLRRWLVPGLALLILALLLAVAAGTYTRNQEAADMFSARVDRARVAARTSLQLEHQITAARKHATLLVRERQGLMVARLLAETTRLLPEGSWLTEFSYRDGEVRMQGVSDAAPSLIALFDASPLFTSAEFRAPLMQAQGRDRENFDLALKVRTGAR